MSNIILCDRCGSIATEKVAGTICYTANPETPEAFYGVCPGCSGEFYRWLKDVDVTSRPMVAHREAFTPGAIPAGDDATGPADTTRAAIKGELA